MTTTAIDLLDAIRAHLREFELPQLWALTITASAGRPGVSVQLACRHEPPEIASALLSWADTLTEPTAEAWRVPSGDSVHLSVTGRLPVGAACRVFDAVPFTERGLGADLAPDASTTVLLTALRTWATLGEVPA